MISESMIMHRYTTSILLFVVGFLCSTAESAIILTVGNQTFQENSGIQLLDVYARTDSGDTSDFLTADFELASGVFSVNAALLGGPSFIGEGNIQNSSVALSTGNNFATISIDFENAQSFPAVNTIIAQLRIDTTGVPIGNNYSVTIVQSAAQVPTTNVAGSFSVVAIPEPSSIALIAVATVGQLWRRRRALASI